MPRILTTAADTTTLMQVLGQGYPVVAQELGALGVAAASFVYRPGGIAGGNVFTTWPSLVTALAAVQGPKTVSVDASIAPTQVPVGTWTLNEVTLVGASTFTAATLTFVSGAKLIVTPDALRVESLILGGVLATPVIEVSAGITIGLTLYNASLATTGAPFAQTSGGGILAVISILSGLETGVLGTTSVADVVVVLAYQGYRYGANVVQGTVGVRELTGDDTGFFGLPQTNTTTNLAAQATLNRYSPSQPAYFFTVPTTVAEALNQLSGAAALDGAIQNGVTPQTIVSSTPTTVLYTQNVRSVPAGFAQVTQLVIPANGVYQVDVRAGFGSGGLPAGADTMAVRTLLNGAPLAEFNRAIVNVNNPNTCGGSARGFFLQGQVLTAQIEWSGTPGNGAIEIAPADRRPILGATLLR